MPNPAARPPILAVLDTNVLVAGLRTTGPSFRVLRRAAAGGVRPVVTVPLLLEYEDVLKRPGKCPLSPDEIDRFLEGFLLSADVRRWYPRPLPNLPDADDERVFRAALAEPRCVIVTENVRHLRPAEASGLLVLTPAEFLDRYFADADELPSPPAPP